MFIPEWVIYHEVVKTNQYYMREVSEIQFAWLTELAPHFYQDARAKHHEDKHSKEIQNQLSNDLDKNYKKSQNN